MLKPYTRQQIQTNKVLSSISNMQERNILEQILIRKDTLYNIIPITQYNIPLKDVITNTDNVVIVIYKPCSMLYNILSCCIVLDKNGGYSLDTLERWYVGTENCIILNSVGYVIETNYRSINDVYSVTLFARYSLSIVNSVYEL